MDELAHLTALLGRSERTLVLTGAGVSTLSGIPDYRDDAGEWKHARPVLYQDFVQRHSVRQRYWARSMIGWRYFSAARPNPAHYALAALSQVRWLVTQNVDGLHQQAGSRNVIDLHGRLETVVCLQCQDRQSRAALQAVLEQRNPGWQTGAVALRPDGDVEVSHDTHSFDVPACQQCGGLLKPDVVFYGESVPRHTVARTNHALQSCDVLLVVGSSLMVRSGFRFAEQAARRGIPRLLVNRGRTRADELFTLRVSGCCADILGQVATRLGLAAGA